MNVLSINRSVSKRLRNTLFRFLVKLSALFVVLRYVLILFCSLIFFKLFEKREFERDWPKLRLDLKMITLGYLFLHISERIV